MLFSCSDAKPFLFFLFYALIQKSETFSTMAWLTTSMEVQSFVTKFQQLTDCGFEAALSFNCSNGQIFVNFQANLSNQQPSFLNQKKKSSKNKTSKKQEQHRKNTKDKTKVDSEANCEGQPYLNFKSLCLSFELNLTLNKIKLEHGIT